MQILPRTLGDSEGRSLNHIRSNIRKIFKEVYLPVFAFIFMTGIIIIIRYITMSLSTHHHFSNRALSEEEKIRDVIVDNDNDTSYNMSDYELKVDLLSKINHDVFSGNWSFDSLNDDNHNGLIYMQIATNKNIRPNALTIILRAIEGNYAMQWKEIQTKAEFNSIIVSNTSTSFIIQSKEDQISTIEANEVSELNNKTNCNMSFHLTFTNDNIKSSQYDKANGNLSSNCSINLKFQLSIDKPLSDFNIITFYSVALSFICLCTSANTLWLNSKVPDSESYANSFSLFTIYQNVIWNAYGCLTHIFFSLNSIQYFIQFLIPTVLYFINFAIIDLRLLYSLWRLKYNRLISNPLLIKKKMMELYSLFYFMLFISLFFVNKFYFNKGYIILGVILTWLPQIIYNAAYKNNILLPGISILTISISRLFFPCYCRGYSGNFFLIEPDYMFVSLCVIGMILMIALMYSQLVFGARWFLPKRFSDNDWDYYKTMDELIRIKNDADKIECVICLNRLIDIKNCDNCNSGNNAKYFSNDFATEGESQLFQTKAKERFNAIRDALCAKNLFDFIKRNSNLTNKPYMLTQCNHAFHSNCLESWFIQKKECPNCRTELNMG